MMVKEEGIKLSWELGIKNGVGTFEGGVMVDGQKSH